MILVDRDIKARAEKGQLISAGFSEENINSISYDLTIESIISESGLLDVCDVAPNEYVLIQTKEVLSIPQDIMGRIAEKNSKMRLGLKVDGPHYHPGHESTKAYLRVYNISKNIITVKAGDKIAQIIFEELKSVPEHPYSSTFQHEMQYVGLGQYKNEYDERIKSFHKVKDDIEHKEQQIYSNILTFMGIFVAIFSLITINFQAYSEAKLDTKFILSMNVSLCFCITVMLGLILLFFNKPKNKIFTAIYSAIILLLGAATLLICLI